METNDKATLFTRSIVLKARLSVLDSTESREISYEVEDQFRVTC